MNRILLFLIIILIGAFYLLYKPQFGPSESPPEALGEAVEAETEPSGPPAPKILKRVLIEEGSTFAEVTELLGFAYQQMQAILEAGTDIYDFTTIKAGKEIVLIDSGDAYPLLQYDINSEDQVIVTQSGPTSFTVLRQPIAYEVSLAEASGTIESSLFLAGNEAGLEDRTILALADIFAWEIDFATVIQTGDSFALVYEERMRDGVRGPDGEIHAATFYTGGKKYTAVRFEDPEGSIGYYTYDGESLQKPFLKAPLTYSRISSGFSYARFHPVTQSTAPHRAIDYAAPIGTPILATGDGVVTRASWNGGYGNYISIRHNDTWDTAYAHLSKYAVSAGERVKQGQIIGYVGSTGWSTGPHLHYEMIKNGTKVNPLEVELPAGDPIKDEWRASFEQTRSQYQDFFSRQ